MQWNRAGVGLRTSLAAIALGLMTAGLASAQTTPPAELGFLQGTVARCVNGVDTPIPGALVSAEGGPSTSADNNGNFLLALPPGMHTLNVKSDQFGTGQRPNVPVTAGPPPLDVGTLFVGAASVFGCGEDVAPAAATPSPSPTATIAPSPTATATPAPADVAPDAVPPDMAPPAPDSGDPAAQPAPADMAPPDGAGSSGG